MKDTSLALTDYKVMDERNEEIEVRSSAVEVNSVQDKFDAVEEEAA